MAARNKFQDRVVIFYRLNHRFTSRFMFTSTNMFKFIRRSFWTKLTDVCVFFFNSVHYYSSEYTCILLEIVDEY